MKSLSATKKCCLLHMCVDAIDTSATRSLEQLLVSLQWGRQQTYYPSAQPLSTGELAAANHKLAESVNSHLLGNTAATSSSATKSSGTAAENLCTNTPAEKMAEKVPCVKNLIRFCIHWNIKKLKSAFCRRCSRFWIQFPAQKTRQILL